MNLDKRYCQNRASKLKKQSDIGDWHVINEDASTSIEEERQFKLSRFVNDVNKFVQDKEQRSDKIHRRHSYKEKAALLKPKKTVIPSKPKAKMGLFRNGVQTKFYTRGLMGKELTARLDEDLHQIIALATNNKENERHNTQQKLKPAVSQLTTILDKKPLHTITSRRPLLTEQWSGEGSQARQDRDLYPNFTRIITNSAGEGSQARQDRELYPNFTRIITNSAVESLTARFTGIDYSSEKKKKLLDIYLEAKREMSQESAGLPDTEESSVANSPLRSLICLPSSPLHSRQECVPDTFDVNFVPEPSKSFRQILEETTDTRSTLLAAISPPQGRKYRSSMNFQHTFHYPSPPVSHTSMNKFEPNTYESSVCQFSSLLPPIEEDSPELQYYPKLVF